MAFSVLAQPAIACPPPERAMAADEYVKWEEAHPCGMIVDVEKYTKIRAECMADTDTDDAANHIMQCNHQAYTQAEIKQ